MTTKSYMRATRRKVQRQKASGTGRMPSRRPNHSLVTIQWISGACGRRRATTWLTCMPAKWVFSPGRS